MKKNNDWFYINDFDDFVESSRRLVFKFFGNSDTSVTEDVVSSSITDMSDSDIEEMETTLSTVECALIVKNHAKQKVNKKTKKTVYLINDKILQAIIEDINTRMISNILNKLVNKGILESGYDADINDFVFWVKDEDDSDKKEKPETD